jgi:beta-glucosidase/6-phospho-beta-glucosidase/beta-galactosidase
MNSNLNNLDFKSFLMAGFECSYPLVRNQERWDLLRDSTHEPYLAQDYARIKELGIRTVREGMAWHQIDKGGGHYDFSRFEQMMRIAHEQGIQQIWDLNHYDYPEYLDPFSNSFIDAFAGYALNCAKIIRKYQSGTIYLVLINEISYWAWIGADLGEWAPYSKGVENGIKFKAQLIKATIAATDAIKKADGDIRFIQVDPFMYREAIEPASEQARSAARDFNTIARFQTWDMLSGKAFPELGGKPEYLDILGINYYVDNQQWLLSSDDQKHIQFERVPIDHPKRKSVGEMLAQIIPRYERPLLITETGSYGDYRKPWWKRFLCEIEECLGNGIPLYGVCAYPTLDNPDEGHFLAPHSGLWDFRQDDAAFQRIPHESSIALIRDFQKRLSLARGATQPM